MSYIDTKSKGKGITIDVKYQLVYIQLKKGQSINQTALSKAIVSAGYVPAKLYKPSVGSNKKVSIKSITLTQPAKKKAAKK